MFMSGYLVFYAFNYFIYILMSFWASSLADYVGKEVDEAGNVIANFSNKFIISLEFETFAILLLYAGVIVLIFRHWKKLSNIVIWVAVACFFGPLFLEFLGLAFKTNFFYTWLKDISYLASVICASMFYYKLANQTSQDTVGGTYAPVA